MSESQLPLHLEPRTWGGKRDGAGRKKSGTRRDPLHRVRPEHVARYPLHVVLRVRKEVGRLRRRDVYTAAREVLTRLAERAAFRVVHLSLQRNHLHLIVEAEHKEALSSGMRSLAISLARRINRSLGRTGKVFEFRYHVTRLTTPRQVRNALVYVLNNWRRHGEDLGGPRQRAAILDPYSSAVAFTGWHDYALGPLPDGYVPLPVAAAETWLLEKGWRCAGKPISAWEVPGPIERAARLFPRRGASVRLGSRARSASRR